MNSNFETICVWIFGANQNIKPIWAGDETKEVLFI
jgi:hypothetical protein